MNTLNFLSIYLVLHITGFTMMAGSILADYVIRRRMASYLIIDKGRAIAVAESLTGLTRLMGIGGALLLVTGIAMLSVFKGTVGAMLWFKIKMMLVLLVAFNGSVVTRRYSNRMKVLLGAGDDRNNGAILVLKRRMGIFHGIELLLFLLIFILSVFKF